MLSLKEFEMLANDLKSLKASKVKITAEALLDLVKVKYTHETVAKTMGTRDRASAIQSTHAGKDRQSSTSERELSLGVKVRTEGESSRADSDRSVNIPPTPNRQSTTQKK